MNQNAFIKNLLIISTTSTDDNGKVYNILNIVSNLFSIIIFQVLRMEIFFVSDIVYHGLNVNFHFI